PRLISPAFALTRFPLSGLLLVLAICAYVALPASPAWGQDEAEPAETSEEDRADEATTEGDADAASGANAVWTPADVDKHRKDSFLNWLKFVPVVLVFCFWILTGDWVNRSSQIHGLGYGKWNPIVL